MAISFICHDCDTTIHAPAGAAGRTMTCPKCKASLTVPGARVDTGAPKGPPKPPRVPGSEKREPERPRRERSPAPAPGGSEKREPERPRRERSPAPTTDLDQEDEPHKKPAMLVVAIAGGCLLLLLIGLLFFLMGGNDEKKQVAEEDPAKQNDPPKTKEQKPSVIPFAAVAPRDVLEKIKVIQIRGTARFEKSTNVNDISYTWEGTNRLLCEEKFRVGVPPMRALLVGGQGWMTGAGQIKVMKDDLLSFYQNFNYATILSNLVALTSEEFEVVRIGNAQVRGSDCFGIAVKRDQYPELRMYFDGVTSLLVSAQFQGHFVDQNLRQSPTPTVVDFYFSDYRKVEGINHWHLQEQYRDGQKYCVTTVHEVRFFKEADDSLFYVAELKDEVARATALETGFKDALDALDKAIIGADIAGARENLALANRLRPTDPSLPAYRTQVSKLEEAVFQRAISDCEKLFREEKFAESSKRCAEGLLARNEPRLREVKTAADKCLQVAMLFDSVQKARKDGAIDQAGKDLAQCVRAVRDVPDSSLTQDFLKKRSKSASDLRDDLLGEVFKSAARSRDQLSKAIAAKDLDDVPNLGAELRKQLARAETFLKITDGLLQPDESKAKELDAEKDTADRLIRKGDCYLAFAEGKKQFATAIDAFAKAKDNPALLHEARAAFESACKLLTLAESEEETMAKADNKAALAEIAKIDRLIRPILLDPALQDTLKGWTTDGWKTFAVDQGTALKGASNKTLSIENSRFPKSFVLEVDFALVTNKGVYANDSLKSYANLLNITVLSDKGPASNLNLVFGRSDIKFNDVAGVTINNKNHTVSRLSNIKGDITLSISQVNNKLKLAIGSDELKLPALETGNFNGIKISVKNATDSQGNPRVFPVIRKVTVRVPAG